MGAEPFDNYVAKSEQFQTAQEAFNEAKASAQYSHGHAGYTGTIAEKDSFESRNNGKPIPRDLVVLWADRDGSGQDKWGPAYMVPVGESFEDLTIVGWLFYGWASS